MPLSLLALSGGKLNTNAKSGNQTVLSDDVTQNESNSDKWKLIYHQPFIALTPFAPVSLSLFFLLPASQCKCGVKLCAFQ